MKAINAIVALGTLGAIVAGCTVQDRTYYPRSQVIRDGATAPTAGNLGQGYDVVQGHCVIRNGGASLLARLVAVEPVAADPAKPALDAVGLIAQAVGGALAYSVAAIEPLDLALNLVDPRLERANLAVIVVVPVTVRLPVGLRLRVILRGRGRRKRESRTGGGERYQNFTHHGSPCERLMRMLCADSLEARLNAPVIVRSTSLTIQYAEEAASRSHG